MTAHLQPKIPSIAAAAVAVLALATGAASAQEKAYQAVVTSEARTDTGMFDVHRVGDRLLFEIPDALLGRDMLIMSRYARTQDGLADGGATMAPNLAVRWERREDRILLRAPSHRTTADDGTPLALAVANSNFPAVLQALPIAARGKASSVVDVTDMYMADTPAFSLPRGRRTQLGVRGYDRARSWLEWSRSFPINVEVRVVRTYAADQPPSSNSGASHPAGRRAGSTRSKGPRYWRAGK